MARRELETKDSGVSVGFAEGVLTFKGAKGAVSRKLVSPFVSVSLDGTKIVLEMRSDKRTPKAVAETFMAHMRNMIHGASHGFEYRMEVVQSHFPIKVLAEQGGIRIENFIGEKAPRVVKISKDVKVKIDGKSLILSGGDIEEVAKAAQQIEDATKIKKKDHRTFQDGIYIVERGKRGNQR